MNVGMLWLDNDKSRSLEQKVERAADYYRQKYGCAPNCCLVHPTMLIKKIKVGDIEVAPLSTVLPHHFWLGVENK